VPRTDVHRPALGLVVVAATAACLGAAVFTLPRDGAPLPQVARDALESAIPKWHTTEPVNAIVYGTRGFDTFGETFILLAAVVGVVVIGRSKERRRTVLLEDVLAREEQAGLGSGATGSTPERSATRGAERDESAEEEGHTARAPDEPEGPVGARAPERASAMTVVVRGGIRAVAPVLAVAGIYLAAWGYSPGGGFPAGAVLAGVILLAYVAYGHRAVSRIVHRNTLENVELIGAAAIIGLEVAGLVVKGSFSANMLPLGAVQSIRSGGLLQAFSASELLEVATGLTLVTFALLSMGSDWAEEEQAEHEERTGP
jgi:multicomponent Na+:H+ antiporter subunit B